MSADGVGDAMAVGRRVFFPQLVEGHLFVSGKLSKHIGRVLSYDPGGGHTD